MKLKDLICGREKLRKYDELKEWKEKLENSSFGDSARCLFECTSPRELKGAYTSYPDNIRDIFVKALEAEISKLDEE